MRARRYGCRDRDSAERLPIAAVSRTTKEDQYEQTTRRRNRSGHHFAGRQRRRHRLGEHPQGRQRHRSDHAFRCHHLADAHRRRGARFRSDAVRSRPKDVKKMDPFIHYGIAGSVAGACAMPGLEVARAANAERIGVAVGAGIGGINTIERHTIDAAREGPASRCRRSSCRARSSTWSRVNLSIMFGLKGPNIACVTACTTAHAQHRPRRAHDPVRRCRRDDRRRRRIRHHGTAMAASARRARCPRATTSRPRPAVRGTRIATASCCPMAPACW